DNRLTVDQDLTRRWCVLGIFKSSRYFVMLRRVTEIPSSFNMSAIFSSVSGFRGSSFSMYFLTFRFTIKSDVPLPMGPLTASEKKNRSSNTPCGVCANLLATARLTVDG